MTACRATVLAGGVAPKTPCGVPSWSEILAGVAVADLEHPVRQEAFNFLAEKTRIHGEVLHTGRVEARTSVETN